LFPRCISLIQGCWIIWGEQTVALLISRKQELKHKWDIIKRCTRLPALTVERNVKFRSNQTAPGQFTAESAIANEDHHEGTKL
jgi:hypothetical protein